MLKNIRLFPTQKINASIVVFGALLTFLIPSFSYAMEMPEENSSIVYMPYPPTFNIEDIRINSYKSGRKWEASINKCIEHGPLRFYWSGCNTTLRKEDSKLANVRVIPSEESLLDVTLVLTMTSGNTFNLNAKLFLLEGLSPQLSFDTVKTLAEKQEGNEELSVVLEGRIWTSKCNPIFVSELPTIVQGKGDIVPILSNRVYPGGTNKIDLKCSYDYHQPGKALQAISLSTKIDIRNINTRSSFVSSWRPSWF